MKARNLFLMAFALFGLLVFTTPAISAQTCDGSGSKFVDLNGDGFNDNAPDADGDGIPNGLDEDWIKHQQDGDGYQHRNMNGKADAVANKAASQTKNENGILTRTQKFFQLQAFYAWMFQHRFGQLGSTTGAASTAGVCDGSGGNSDGMGTGVCDGTGPHGYQNKGGK